MRPQEIIAKLRLTEDAADARWAGTPKRVWRGSRWKHGIIFADPTGDWNTYDELLAAGIWDRHEPERAGWQYVESWIDGPYRVVWVNYEHLAVFTYCEGDLILVTCDDRATFDTEIEGAEKCYGKMAPAEATVE